MNTKEASQLFFLLREESFSRKNLKRSSWIGRKFLRTVCLSFSNISLLSFISNFLKKFWKYLKSVKTPNAESCVLGLLQMIVKPRDQHCFNCITVFCYQLKTPLRTTWSWETTCWWSFVKACHPSPQTSCTSASQLTWSKRRRTSWKLTRCCMRPRLMIIVFVFDE